MTCRLPDPNACLSWGSRCRRRSRRGSAPDALAQALAAPAPARRQARHRPTNPPSPRSDAATDAPPAHVPVPPAPPWLHALTLARQMQTGAISPQRRHPLALAQSRGERLDIGCNPLQFTGFDSVLEIHRSLHMKLVISSLAINQSLTKHMTCPTLRQICGYTKISYSGERVQYLTHSYG